MCYFTINLKKKQYERVKEYIIINSVQSSKTTRSIKETVGEVGLLFVTFAR